MKIENFDVLKLELAYSDHTYNVDTAKKSETVFDAQMAELRNELKEMIKHGTFKPSVGTTNVKLRWSFYVTIEIDSAGELTDVRVLNVKDLDDL